MKCAAKMKTTYLYSPDFIMTAAAINLIPMYVYCRSDKNLTTGGKAAPPLRYRGKCQIFCRVLLF